MDGAWKWGSSGKLLFMQLYVGFMCVNVWERESRRDIWVSRERKAAGVLGHDGRHPHHTTIYLSIYSISHYISRYIRRAFTHILPPISSPNSANTFLYTKSVFYVHHLIYQGHAPFSTFFICSPTIFLSILHCFLHIFSSLFLAKWTIPLDIWI